MLPAVRSLSAALLLLVFPATSPPAFKVPPLDLGLTPPPTGEELKARPAPAIKEERPEARPDEEGISVVRVEHGTLFSRTADGLRAKAPLLWLGLPEKTGATPAFSTVVRIHSVARADLEVQVRVVDPRGTAVMESEGTVSFRGSTKQAQDHVVDWAPTVLRGGGRYTVEVSLNRRPAGSFPLEIRDGVQSATTP